MSILIRGMTGCALCGERIEVADDAVQLPAFAWGASDPFWNFSDASFHAACFNSDPRRAGVERVVEEVLARTRPGARSCAVCGHEITEPDDYVLIPRLTDDERHPLFGFRYTHLHKSHVSRWRDYEQFMLLLRQLAATSAEPHTDWLLKELTQARGQSVPQPPDEEPGSR